MSAVTPAGTQPYYFVPAPSRHPASAAFGLLLVIFGASQWVNGVEWGAWVLLAGFLVWAFVLQQWFRQAIGESEGDVAVRMALRAAHLRHYQRRPAGPL